MSSVRYGTFRLIAIALILSGHVGAQATLAIASEAKQFTLINVIFDGTKVWLPTHMILQEGDEVELTLINKLDDPHGFQIAAFGIETVVQPKAKTTVRFTASQAGLYPFICHLHPPHLGGQILVLGK